MMKPSKIDKELKDVHFANCICFPDEPDERCLIKRLEILSLFSKVADDIIGENEKPSSNDDAALKIQETLVHYDRNYLRKEQRARKKRWFE